MTSRVRPESRPVLFNGGPSGVGRLYFSRSSGPVRSVVAHSLPARFEILIVRAQICMTVLFQCKLWLCRLFLFCTVQSPAHHRAYCDDARSWDRERGLSKWSGVDVHVYISRSDRLLFRLWQRYGPARAHSGAPLYCRVWAVRASQSLQFACVCVHMSVRSINA